MHRLHPFGGGQFLSAAVQRDHWRAIGAVGRFNILPAHLGIEYVFWYITWEELERKISCWAEIEERQLTWEQLETLVDETEEWAGT